MFFAKSSNIFSSEENACFEDIAKPFFLAIMLISHLPVIRCLFNRKYSRIKRLILFRMAAHPIFLVTVMPSLVVSDPPGPITAIKCSFMSFLPFSDSLINSVRLRILADFLKLFRLNQISRNRIIAFQATGTYRLLHPYFKKSALCCRSLLHSDFTSFFQFCLNG